MPNPSLIQIQPISAWSYSRHQTYEQCPQKAKYLYVDKMREPDSAAGLKGTRVHAIAAMMATGIVPKPDRDNMSFINDLKPILLSKEFPRELAAFEEEFKTLRKMKNLSVEAEWAFTKDWNVTSWFGSDAWLRIKVDLFWLEVLKQKALRETTVFIRDHKTGKVHADHKHQRSLYALGAFLMYPDAVAVDVAHWYLDQGHEEKQVYFQKDFEKLKKEWLKKTKAMLNDTTFAPRQGDYCRWCHFSKAKNGPCKF